MFKKIRLLSRKRKPKHDLSENFFPAMPRQLWIKTRSATRTRIDAAKRIGLPVASNPAYIRWLIKESMLGESKKLSGKYSGKGVMWQKPFARPRPRQAVMQASVWYTAYPASLITKPGQSIIGALGEDDLWQMFQKIGISGIHTGPMKRAGGQNGWYSTPSIDGHFDRISTKTDALFGTENEFKNLAATAKHHDGIVIDDIVPGHTGKGSDFRLAEMGYGEYPGIYHMVEVEQKDWHMLPAVEKGKDSANINEKQEDALKKAGYIIGKLQRVIFYEPGVKDTNWSATKIVKGVDGVKRRWVYLHYFKDGQPSLNWLDPTFAAMRLVIGDALHSIGELGSTGLRLDANGFLGVEKGIEDEPAWSEGHPLSGAANQMITSLVRKLGGFTFQELNLSVDDIKIMSEAAADLSYDFVTRPAYHHALATGDTEFLRLMLNTSLQMGVDPASLVHAMQNHDELTFELVHFWTIHKDDQYTYHNQIISGSKLRDIVRKDLYAKLTPRKNHYNLPFTENGVACTMTSLIASIIGVRNLDEITPGEIETVKKMHLLLAKFNAWQPGVFALSGWDLTGSLTLHKSEVDELIKTGDTRWVNRGSYDLLGDSPNTKTSSAGLPKARSLYGSLPEQLADELSFGWQLKELLKVREELKIPIGHQLEVPDVTSKGLLAMIHELPQKQLQVTLLNFSNESIKEDLYSKHFNGKKRSTNVHTKIKTKVSNSKLLVELNPYEGICILIN